MDEVTNDLTFKVFSSNSPNPFVYNLPLTIVKSGETEHLIVIRADWEGFFNLWLLLEDYDWHRLDQRYPAGQGYKILRFPPVIIGEESVNIVPSIIKDVEADFRFQFEKWPITVNLNLTNKETVGLFDNSTDIFPIGSTQERRLSQYSVDGITYEILENEPLDTYWQTKRYCEDNGYQENFQR